MDEKNNSCSMGICELAREDLEDTKRVIYSNDFAKFLLSKTTSFVAAAWMLQVLIDAEKDASAALNQE